MSSNELGLSLATYLELGLTPSSLGPCLPAFLPRAALAKSAAPPASLNSSRRPRNSDRLVISDDGMRGMALYSTPTPRRWFRGGVIRFGGLCLAHDGRHGRDGLLLGWRGGLPLHAGIPPVARGPLLIGRKLVAVLVADEAGARSAGAVGAAFDAAAHVERAAGALRFRRQPDD